MGRGSALIINPFRPEFTIHHKPPIAELLSQFSTVEEDGLMWLANGKKLSLLLKQFRENVRFKTPRCRKLGHSSEMQNAALMHREGLKG